MEGVDEICDMLAEATLSEEQVQEKYLRELEPIMEKEPSVRNTSERGELPYPALLESDISRCMLHAMLIL